MNIGFDTMICSLMHAMNVNNHQLAEKLAIDSSLISRWKKGSRIPPLTSDYCDKIAELLENDVEIGKQKSAIIQLLEYYGQSVQNNEEMKNLLKELLYSAVKTSHNALNGVGIITTGHEEKIVGLFEDETRNMKDIPQLFNSYIATGEELVLYLKDDEITIRPILLELMQALIKKESDIAEKKLNIYINRVSSNEHGKEFDEKITASYEVLINKGWQINILVQNQVSIVKLLTVDNFVRLITYNNLHINYKEDEGASCCQYDTFCIPGTISVQLYKDLKNQNIQYGFVYLNRQIASMHSNEIEHSIKKAFPITSNQNRTVNFSNHAELFTQLNNSPGKIFLLSPHPSFLTMPQSLYQLYHNMAGEINTDDNTKNNDFREDFMEKLKMHEICEIMVVDGMDEIIDRGQHIINFFSRKLLLAEKKENILTHLNNIITLLDSWENYHLSLIDRDLLGKNYSVSWLVKENKLAVTGTYSRQDNTPAAAIFLKEPGVINAFIHEHKSLWNKTPAKWKDREYIRRTIHDYIKMLE